MSFWNDWPGCSSEIHLLFSKTKNECVLTFFVLIWCIGVYRILYSMPLLDIKCIHSSCEIWQLWSFYQLYQLLKLWCCLYAAFYKYIKYIVKFWILLGLGPHFLYMQLFIVKLCKAQLCCVLQPQLNYILNTENRAKSLQKHLFYTCLSNTEGNYFNSFSFVEICNSGLLRLCVCDFVRK